MAAHCCYTRMVKRWSGSFFRKKVEEKRAHTIMNHVMPKPAVFQLHIFIADVAGLASDIFAQLAPVRNLLPAAGLLTTLL